MSLHTMTLHRVVTRIEAYGEDRPPSSPIRTLRALRHLSASELARLADVHRATIRRLENDLARPQERTAVKIAAVFGCPVELLFPEAASEHERPADDRALETTSADTGDGYGES